MLLILIKQSFPWNQQIQYTISCITASEFTLNTTGPKINLLAYCLFTRMFYFSWHCFFAQVNLLTEVPPSSSLIISLSLIQSSLLEIVPFPRYFHYSKGLVQVLIIIIYCYVPEPTKTILYALCHLFPKVKSELLLLVLF